MNKSGCGEIGQLLPGAPRGNQSVHLFRDWLRGINIPKRFASLLLLLVASVVALAACAGEPTVTPKPTSATESPQSTPTAEAPTAGESTPTHEPDSTQSPETSTDQIADGPIAPELTGIAGWINTEPFTWRSLRGKVVLIDFWTYTCVNCIRTCPALKEWHDMYAD